LPGNELARYAASDPIGISIRRISHWNPRNKLPMMGVMTAPMAAARSLWRPSILPMLKRAKMRNTARPLRSLLDSEIDNTYIFASLNIKEAINEYYL